MNLWTTALLGTTTGYQGFWVNPQLMLWSGALRMAQAAMAAAPFVLAGALTAGILRGMVGQQLIRRWLAVGHWSAPLRAWFLGILMPICALGALPVARELRRAGISSGTIISFVLVAPVLNPISILYGLSHIEPITLIYFVVGTMFVSLGVGYLWDWLISRHRDAYPVELTALPRSSLKRIAITGIAATRGIIGPDLIDYGLAILTVGLMGVLIPYGTLQFSLTRDNWMAPFIMSLVAIPAYVTPFDVMVQYGMIVRDGYSLGAAFSLIVLGAGANVGVANWIRRDYGIKPLLLFVALLLVTTFSLGLSADRLIHHGKAAVDHTHAFDSYTRLNKMDSAKSPTQWFLDTLESSINPTQVYGLTIFSSLVVTGLVLYGLRRYVSIDRLLANETSVPEDSSWNRPVSTRVLVGVSLATLTLFVSTMLYVFYPPPEQILGEMKPITTELYTAVRYHEHDEINRRVEQWDNLARKLPVATIIRRGKIELELRSRSADLLHLLELIREYNEHGQYPPALALLGYLDRTYHDTVTLYEDRLNIKID